MNALTRKREKNSHFSEFQYISTGELMFWSKKGEEKKARISMTDNQQSRKVLVYLEFWYGCAELYGLKCIIYICMLDSIHHVCVCVIDTYGM